MSLSWAFPSQLCSQFPPMSLIFILRSSLPLASWRIPFPTKTASKTVSWLHLPSIHLFLIQTPGVAIFEVNFSFLSPPGSLPGYFSSFSPWACMFSTWFPCQSPVSLTLVHVCLHPTFVKVTWCTWGLPGWLSGKESVRAGDTRELGLIPEVRMSPWSRKWQPTSVFLPGNSHGQWSPRATVHGAVKS